MSTAPAIADRMLTVPLLARRLAISPNKVLTWIRSGQLRAIDVSTNAGGRPRWRISEDELTAFELRRSNSAPVVKGRRRKRDSGITEFF